MGFTASFCGAFLGLILGVASAYFGGYIDLVLQRVCDVFMAFPLIIMALAIVSIFGTGVEMVIIAITIPFIPNCARVVRSSALALKVSHTSTLPGRSDMATFELLCVTWFPMSWRRS